MLEEAAPLRKRKRRKRRLTKPSPRRRAEEKVDEAETPPNRRNRRHRMRIERGAFMIVAPCFLGALVVQISDWNTWPLRADLGLFNLKSEIYHLNFP